MVSQFYGLKEAALYHPDRASQLQDDSDDTSFGGFKNVREPDRYHLSHEPDYQGTLEAGDMIYIPHGWLHDVMVRQDSVSVTWNFIHRKGAHAIEQYLNDTPDKDSELEVLQYFLSQGGLADAFARAIRAHFSGEHAA